jgi:hypothetical protein
MKHREAGCRSARIATAQGCVIRCSASQSCPTCMRSTRRRMLRAWLQHVLTESSGDSLMDTVHKGRWNRGSGVVGVQRE